jgi:hypothetical protein
MLNNAPVHVNHYFLQTVRRAVKIKAVTPADTGVTHPCSLARASKEKEVMRLAATTTDRWKRHSGNAALVLAIVGVLHFVLSLVVWGSFYVGSYRNGWRNVLTVPYGARHLSPVIVLLGLFAWSTWATFRRRRLALPLLACTVLLSVGAFAVEARGDPQFQRVWFNEPTACSNRQSYYCTWWWWQPTRH